MIADRYDAFLFDLDGVLYRGDQPVPPAADAVRRLRRSGKGISFVTNNSARTPEEVVAHLASVGVDASLEEVETSALTAASGLRDLGIGSAFVIGETGLRSALASADIELVDPDERADAVVVGWDRSLTYEALRAATFAVQVGARLFATNADVTYPGPDGSIWPGTGVTVLALEAATGQRATVFGKPYAPILQAARVRAGGGRPLVIGDRVETDIEGARRLRWDSLLVLTGVSGRHDLAAAGVAATYVIDDLSALFAD
jgi:HAD superfamily hydrolase (TIGR01450 family)